MAAIFAVAFEPQTYFRSSLLSLRKYFGGREKRRPEILCGSQAIFAEDVLKNNASYIKKPIAKNGIYILSCDMAGGNLVFTSCLVRP